MNIVQIWFVFVYDSWTQRYISRLFTLICMMSITVAYPVKAFGHKQADGALCQQNIMWTPDVHIANVLKDHRPPPSEMDFFMR